MGELTGWVFSRILEEKAQALGDRPFLQYEDDPPVSYAEADRQANRMANGLAHLGLSKGDGILILMDNCLEFVYAWLGAMKLGAVQVTSNTYMPDYLPYLLEEAQPKVLVLSERVLNTSVSLREVLHQVDQVVVWSGQGGRGESLEDNAFPFERLLEFPETPPGVEVKHSDPERINYTFKTSGRFVGVPKTHAQNYMSVKNYVEMVQLSPDDVCLVCSPLIQSHTQVFGVYPALVSEARAVILRGFNRKLFWYQARQVRATVTNCLGVMLYFIWLQPFRQDDPQNPLRVIVTNIWTTREYFLSWGTVTMDGEVLTPEGWKGFQTEFEERFQVKLLDGSTIEGFGPTEEQMPSGMFFWPM